MVNIKQYPTQKKVYILIFLSSAVLRYRKSAKGITSHSPLSGNLPYLVHS